MTSVKRKRNDDKSEKTSFSQSLSTDKVQALISREVQSALEESNKTMKALMDRILKVDNEPGFDARIRKLEADVRKVKRRSNVVFANMQTQSPKSKNDAKVLNSSANGAVFSTSASEDGGGEGGGKGGTTRKPKEGFWQSLRTKNQIVDLTDDGEVCKQNGTNHSDPPQTSSQDNVNTRQSPLADGETPCPVILENKTLEMQEAEETLQSRLPPFPDTPFPDQLPVAAASKSMPQKPIVKVAHIKNPRGVALLWNVEEDDPDAAAMDCYYIYVTQERSDGTFPKWKTMGVIKAMPLPMACRVAAEQSGDKTLCFLIIGKDVYGRYGPYSDVHVVSGGET